LSNSRQASFPSGPREVLLKLSSRVPTCLAIAVWALPALCQPTVVFHKITEYGVTGPDGRGTFCRVVNITPSIDGNTVVFPGFDKASTNTWGTLRAANADGSGVRVPRRALFHVPRGGKCTEYCRPRDGRARRRNLHQFRSGQGSGPVQRLGRPVRAGRFRRARYLHIAGFHHHRCSGVCQVNLTVPAGAPTGGDGLILTAFGANGRSAEIAVK
jgi:hypothetical protein